MAAELKRLGLTRVQKRTGKATLISERRIERETIEEVDGCIDALFTDLSRRYGVPKPRFSVMPLLIVYLPLFSLRMIVIGTRYYSYWEIDKEKTRRCLRYVIAHEFCHYLQSLEGKIPTIGPTLRATIKSMIRAVTGIYYLTRSDLEREADHFAEAYSRLTFAELRETLRELNGQAS